ncbi:hypothetical protein P9112_006988 [Eukaryota sp. TZLM1-RC]
MTTPPSPQKSLPAFRKMVPPLPPSSLSTPRSRLVSVLSQGDVFSQRCSPHTIVSDARKQLADGSHSMHPWLPKSRGVHSKAMRPPTPFPMPTNRSRPLPVPNKA